MLRLGPKRRDLLARTIADFTKAIFAVAVASQFFKGFTLELRLLLGCSLSLVSPQHCLSSQRRTNLMIEALLAFAVICAVAILLIARQSPRYPKKVR